MNHSMIVTFIIFGLFFYFAYIQEQAFYTDGFMEGECKPNDTKRILYKRIWRCLSAERKTIKWRRVFMGSVIATCFIFLLVHQRLPQPRETVMYTIIIYSVWYMTWDNYLSVVSDKAISMGRIALVKVKRQ